MFDSRPAWLASAVIFLPLIFLPAASNAKKAGKKMEGKKMAQEFGETTVSNNRPMT